MSTPSEDNLEQADIDFFVNKLGYRHINADGQKLVGRSSLKEVVLKPELAEAIRRINPQLPDSEVEKAVDELSRNRSSMDLLSANKEVYELIKNGVPLKYDTDEEIDKDAYAYAIDFDHPENNDFAVVSQLTIDKPVGTNRRPDLILYVNGLPLVMIELKKPTVKVKSGYDVNLKNYTNDIPRLFHYNLLVCISNGIKTVMGSFNAPWEHFFSWSKLKDTSVDHDQEPRLALEAASEQTGKKITLQLFCEGVCHKRNLIDYFENFVLYYKGKTKVIAKNHQFLGVNNAIDGLKNRDSNQGRLGVFWHTQGSGKSYSMIFFSRKIRQKVTGNWSFLVVTDRKSLHDQIYRNFVDTGAIQITTKDKKSKYCPKDRKQLQEYLQLNKDYVFALIHKFGLDKGKTFPVLSERKDWIVIIDEAHRSQYKGMAENLRIGLPNAQYIAFTGTPLLRTGLTEKWFGDYVSEYNFAQSIEDGATVPLYYQKNVPKVEQVNDELVPEAAEILANEDLSESQLRKLEKEYSTLFAVVKREDRLKEIARHIANHFPYRLDVHDDEGNPKPMKAMVVSIDKFTAVRMYDFVKDALQEKKKELMRERSGATQEIRERCDRALKFINDTDMAVVVSQEGSDKDEVDAFAKEGLHIANHRRRMDHPDEDGRMVEDYFKDENHNLRIVFVTAMWLTGFDAPSVSTLYLDKPMQDHTLMQTIARANRVFAAKKNGLVVDYFGVFRKLQKALANYAEGSKGQASEDDLDEFPVKEFDELLELLEQAIAEGKQFCLGEGIDLEEILNNENESFKDIALFAEYADRIVRNDELKRQFILYTNTIVSLYDSAKPEVYNYPKLKRGKEVFEYLKAVMQHNAGDDTAYDGVKKEVDELLDRSVLSANSLNEPKQNWGLSTGAEIDLSKIDFEKLRKEFETTPHKHLEFDSLRELLVIKLAQMIRQNRSRKRFLEDFYKIIDEYNADSSAVDESHQQLVDLFSKLSDEEERAAREGMTEDELELFDLLRKGKLTKAEKQKVKLASKHLLERLFDPEAKILVLEWHKTKSTREKVKTEIQRILDEDLPTSYTREIFSNKAQVAYQYFFDLAEEGRGFAA